MDEKIVQKMREGGIYNERKVVARIAKPRVQTPSSVDLRFRIKNQTQLVPLEIIKGHGQLFLGKSSLADLSF